jgi:hypothetical protein
MDEKTLQAQVVYELRRHGWLTHHTRPAQNRRGRWSTPIQGVPGFPDVIAARGGQVLFLEFKATRGRLSADQERWRDVLRAAGQDWRLIRPADLQALYEELIP